MPNHPPAVSVIVPVFNAAALIRRCLTSLTTATRRELEVIVVDDGSTDGSSDVVTAFAQEHSFVRLHRQKNAGVSAARNAGLALATGDFVAFADADDYLLPGAIDALVDHAIGEQLCMVVGNATIDHHDGAGRLLYPCAPLRQSARGADWLVAAVESKLLKHYIWSHLYRRDFLERARLRFAVGISHQDIVWTNQALLAADRVGFLNQPVYCYHRHAGSLSHPQTSSGRLTEASHYLRVAELLEQLANACPAGSRVQEAIRHQIVDEGIIALHLSRKLEPHDREQLYTALRDQRFVRRLSRNARTSVQRRRIIRRACRYQMWQLRCVALAFSAGASQTAFAAMDAVDWLLP